MNKKIYLSSRHMCEERYEEKYVKEVFATKWISSVGETINKFEESIAKYVGAKYAVALSSGTAGIHMALKSVGVKKGDIVFCSTFTFSATANPIIYENATPVFIDSEPESFNMSPIALEKAFEKYPNPKAVIVVHLYGQSADMDKIMELCNKHNVPVIEDAAESLGATYKGKYTGTIGELGVYSFNGNKIITTSGGGMLVSDNKEKIDKIRFWSTQARDKARHYQHSELGYNYRMSNVLAGIGRGQLQVLDKRIAKKKEIYETYKQGFKDIKELTMEPICNYGEPNYWLPAVTVDKNSKVKPLDIMVALENDNIESRPIWKPMHIQPFYEKYDFFNHNENGISVSEDLFNRGVCLPSDTKNTKEDMDRIIKVIKNLF